MLIRLTMLAWAFGLMFVAFKLAHIIAWSWWYTLLPFYLLPAILVIFAGFCFALAGVVAASNYAVRWRARRELRARAMHGGKVG